MGADRVLAGALAAAMLALVPAGSPGAVEEPPVPDRVLVRGSEFDLTLSKPRVRPGRVLIQFLNDGEDPHDLRLQRLREGWPSGPQTGLGELGPGVVENLETTLRRRSTYLLWCSLSDHRGLGMEARLRTKKRRRPAA